MNIKYRHIFFCAFLIMCYAMISPAQSAQLLQNDPFEQPELTLVSVAKGLKATDNRTVREVWFPQLRATMRAGRQSMANIDGEIIKIGEKFDGFKLLEVHERDALFIKNGLSYHVSMDQEPLDIEE